MVGRIGAKQSKKYCQNCDLFNLKKDRIGYLSRFIIAICRPNAHEGDLTLAESVTR